MKTKVNMVAVAAAMVAEEKKRIMTGDVPGALQEAVVLLVTEVLPVIEVLPVTGVPPATEALPAAVVLPGEDSPLWIATRSAASPAREDAPPMKKEAPMVMTREGAAAVAAAVGVAAVPVHHPEAVRVLALPAAAAQVLPEEEETRAAIQEDSSPAAADALAMAAGQDDKRSNQIGPEGPICSIKLI